MEFSWTHYRLDFRFEAKTSRETMHYKDTWFIRIHDELTDNVSVGEASYFNGLSKANHERFIQELHRVCKENDPGSEISAIRFGIESALRNLIPLVDNPFTRGEVGIPLNGLIWMGDFNTMKQRIDEKIEEGFKVIKIKVGGINFEDEINLLKYIRNRYSQDVLEIRLDANGSFKTSEALERINRLSDYHIHSLEQPVKAGNWEEMRKICSVSPIAIALDEELIGTRSYDDKVKLLEAIKPQYLILKPSLCGGFSGANEWVDLAKKFGIGWWGTSALESNVGLMAIALWLYSHNVKMPQGLGTGKLYSNNIPSRIELRGDRLYLNPEKNFVFPELTWHQ